MSRYTRVKNASSSFSASLTQRHYKGSSKYSRDASTELLGHPNWAANLLALTRSASWFVKSLDSQKKNLALMAISLVPSKIFLKNLFPQFVKQKNKRRAHLFSHSNSFPSFCLFLFIYFFLHFSFFFFLLNGARKHQTPWRLLAVLCRWCTRIPLHLLPFSFTLHATLRHSQLHFGQGKRPQKTKTKPTK